MRREALLAAAACAALLLVASRVASNSSPTSLYEFDESELEFAKIHPVYTRCAKLVDMPEFSDEIQRKCGDVHELKEVAAPCHDAMQAASDRFGCCWETVLHGYKTLDPEAHHAWRMWQGTMSGKAGVTFDGHGCGDAMGQKSYEGLKDQVGQLERTLEMQSFEIEQLQYPFYYDSQFKGQGASPQLAQRQVASPPKGRGAARFHPSYHAASQRPDVVV
uniref:Uncharacterized protein n=1 Tax=Hemiselmis andersenii TaxID=464988 RepID=A0A6U5AK50_HEMAN|mmetsp:Transcript_26070/g.60509  ORF Transcript_26070/g.60509 Transcript_26070/m.60509 type:complete len:219 (-) Transcript_26070:97-753(-)